MLRSVFWHFFPLDISAILASGSGGANLDLSLGKESFRRLGAVSVASLGCFEVVLAVTVVHQSEALEGMV